jgi:hypothetical protein
MKIFLDSYALHNNSEKRFIEDMFLPLEIPNAEKIQDIFTKAGKTIPGQFEKWLQFAAEAILIAKSCGIEIDNKIYERFKDISPFGNEILLSDCWDKECACATFPLATKDGNKTPERARVWAVKGLARRESAKQFESIPGDYEIFFVALSEWSGNSCLLALNLAIKAIESDNYEYKKSLAADWIITGDVDEYGKVRRVEVENKLTLDTRRTWLVPLDCEREIMKKLPEGKIANFADDLETGWNHITDTGAKFSGVIAWPEHTDELHILVGGNIKAQVASILLSNSKKIVLWHSDNRNLSIDPASYIKTIVIELKKRLFADLPEPILKQISFENLIDIENSLRKELKNCVNKKIIFNITSGNRIMGFGVQSIARQYPNAIDIIYRERDSAEHSFIILNYRSFPPYFGTVKGACGLKLNYQFLYSAPKEQDYTNATDFLEKLII